MKISVYYDIIKKNMKGRISMKKLLCILSAAIITGTAVFGSIGTSEKTVSATSYSAKAKTKAKTKTTAQKFDTKITAEEVVSQMQVGYNIGNALDCYGDWITGNASAYETAWGNPKITKEYVDAVKKKGFKTIRIPVTWNNHVDGNYKIDSKWLARVKEVVDYAIDDDTYVIINMHHDNSIYDIKSALKSSSNYSKAEKNFTTVWKQIATAFADYDEHLIFESMNEPRIEGSDNEWNGGTQQERAIINKLNSAFVKTVRGTKGNNTYRFLMIPGYAASASDNSLNDVTIPNNDKRIILSVHAYSPYYFAMVEGTSTTFTDSDKKELTDFFKKLNDKFIKKGVPVVIGEMGCVNKNNTAERVKWAKFYTENAAKYNITCLWWDNNAFNVGSENFGMIDRKTAAFKYSDIADALIEGSERD